PFVFISSVTGQGITELKDTLWRAITDDSNRLATPDIVHRPLDGHHRVREEDDFIFKYEPTEEELAEEAEDLRQISPDSWGEDYDYGFYPWDEDVEEEDDQQ
ncbi:MAG: hypothetical protein K2O79_08890, partial [Muribaculaceae bacterium]|nr:hypothetical protein [Muribaculaceae bacterium]